MKVLSKVLGLLTIASCAIAAQSASPIEQNQNRQSLQGLMLTDLDFIKGMFEGYYAPTQWKETSQGWNLDAELAKYQGIVKQNPKMTVKEYQRVLKKFLSTTHDYHVSVTFESTEASSLPFTIKGAEGHYFVVDVDRTKVHQTVYPIEVGDELISFDGKSVEDAILQVLEDEFTPPYNRTDRALAEKLLTLHSGKKGDNVPHGPLLLTFKHAATGQEKSYQMIWDYAPEKIQDISTKTVKSAATKIGKKAVIRENTENLCNDPFFRKMLSPMEDKLNFPYAKRQVTGHDLSARETFIPPLGRVVWRSDASSVFFSYVFLTNDDKIVGYIRLPNFKGSVDEAKEFSDLIEMMQTETDALVIDQINNPGGSLFYLYSLLSNLTDKPLYTPKHRISLSQKDVGFVLKYLPLFELIDNDDDAKAVIGQTFDGLPVTYQLAQFMLNYFRFILDQWNSGNTLTDPIYVYGVDFINPSPYVNYTKPILLLINELDFSGGDFFPSILQDNKRAVLLGTKTAGAGGIVDRTSYINMLGVSEVAFTASIAARVDQNPIENLGVTPDVQYELTPDDFRYGYQGYVDAINNTLNTLISK